MAASRLPVSDLPPGRFLPLEDGRRGFVLSVPHAGDGPAGPPLFLIHGLTITSYLNWQPAFGSLAEVAPVLSMDLRGHGRGEEPGKRFRLEDCADDVVRVMDALGIEQVVPVGYSLGGPVAQLVWRRHPDRVAGMVLAATSRNFGGTRQERAFYQTLIGAAAAVRWGRRVPWRIGAGSEAQHEADPESVATEFDPARFEGAWWAPWALREIRLGRPDSVLLAMNAMGRFSSHTWISEMDVPAAMVVTTRDRAIAPDRQLKLARAIPGCTIHPCPSGHPAAVLAQSKFVPALTEACASVLARATAGVSA